MSGSSNVEETPSATVATSSFCSSDVVLTNGIASRSLVTEVGSGCEDGRVARKCDDCSGEDVGSFSPIRNMELYPPRAKVVGECSQ